MKKELITYMLAKITVREYFRFEKKSSAIVSSASSLFWQSKDYFLRLPAFVDLKSFDLINSILLTTVNWWDNGLSSLNFTLNPVLEISISPHLKNLWISWHWKQNKRSTCCQSFRVTKVMENWKANSFVSVPNFPPYWTCVWNFEPEREWRDRIS